MLLVISCYRNQDKLWPGSYIGHLSHMQTSPFLRAETELDFETARVTNGTNFFPLATNFPHFSLTEILLLATKVENLSMRTS